ncbi:MAG: serine hydrolase domain-containing protein [Bacteroidota bacterium]
MKNLLKILFFGGFLLILFSCAQRETQQPDSISQKLDAYLDAHVANNQFNGNVLISKGDSVVYFRSLGMADRAFGIPNDDSTKFLIGSITKPFTAYGILLLAQQGKLSLKDRLSTYFPDFPHADRITIEQLLTHRSGLTDYHAFPDWKAKSKGDITPQQTLDQVAEKPLIFEPGSKFSYTNTGYIFLGLIIEQVSGRSFEAFMQQEVIIPLGLKYTGVASNEQVIPHLAEGYTTNPRETQKADYINYRQPYASGNMYSTPWDLWKFTQAVMNHTLLPSETTERIFNNSVYGYGWGIRTFDRVKAYGHHGGMNGFTGSITFLPEEAYFICFLTNDDNTPNYTLSEDLVSMVMNKPVALPLPEKLIPLTPDMKHLVVGKYHKGTIDEDSECNLIRERDFLTVSEENNKLYLQETGQPRHELFPIDSNRYALTLLEFHAVFCDVDSGRSQTLKFEGRSNVVARRLKLFKVPADLLNSN